jgi:putative toxin-antitoxin system antitoxin component (TIGR02293 family)
MPSTFGAYHYPLDNYSIMKLIDTVRKGIQYIKFSSIAKQSPFSMPEWAAFLNISERTLQRYGKEKKIFAPEYAEKILEISLLLNKGISIFGNVEKFNTWLETKNIALGGMKPKSLLDSSFGIGMVSDELLRIEHGILA